MIAAGNADIVVAGGTENMSLAPYALKNGRYGYRLGNGSLIDTMVHDALTDAFDNYHMGITAENICDDWKLTREEFRRISCKLSTKSRKSHRIGSVQKRNSSRNYKK